MGLLMRDFNRPKVARGGALAAAMAALAIPGAAHAQYIHNDAPALPAAPAAGTYESPSDRLARNIRILAQQPRNFPALIAAGRASLAVGDVSAAEGFFARADEVNVNDPAPKIGMAGAAVLSGNLDEAQSWFGQAQRLGATQALMGTDRGMLLDLKGDLASAQSDYRAALAGPDPDEARRRYALSLAMGGKMNDGLKILEPLLRMRDPGALRVRAFVLALGGQRQAAVTAIDQAMPGSGSRIAPFFDNLAVLGVAQKAAAVHLGIFPSPAEVRLAEARTQGRGQLAVVAPRPVPASNRSTPRARVSAPVATPTATARKVRKIERPGSIIYDYVDISPRPAPVTSSVPAARQPDPQTSRTAPPQVASVDVAPRPGFALSSTSTPPPDMTPPQQLAMSGERLSGIDKILAETRADPLPPPPPPPRPKVEKPSNSQADSKKSAEAKKEAEAKRKADAEEKALGVAGGTWVQLAGGSNADRMAAEYKRIKAKKPDLFAKRGGYVSQGRDYFRLLVGPFKDSSEARDYVNSLAKVGIESFMWTRSPPTIRIEKLPGK